MSGRHTNGAKDFLHDFDPVFQNHFIEFLETKELSLIGPSQFLGCKAITARKPKDAE